MFKAAFCFHAVQEAGNEKEEYAQKDYIHKHHPPEAVEIQKRIKIITAAAGAFKHDKAVQAYYRRDNDVYVRKDHYVKYVFFIHLRVFIEKYPVKEDEYRRKQMYCQIVRAEKIKPCPVRRRENDPEDEHGEKDVYDRAERERREKAVIDGRPVAAIKGYAPYCKYQKYSADEYVGLHRISQQSADAYV